MPFQVHSAVETPDLFGRDLDRDPTSVRLIADRFRSSRDLKPQMSAARKRSGPYIAAETLESIRMFLLVFDIQLERGEDFDDGVELGLDGAELGPVPVAARGFGAAAGLSERPPAAVLSTLSAATGGGTARIPVLPEAIAAEYRPLPRRTERDLTIVAALRTDRRIRLGPVPEPATTGTAPERRLAARLPRTIARASPEPASSLGLEHMTDRQTCYVNQASIRHARERSRGSPGQSPCLSISRLRGWDFLVASLLALGCTEAKLLSSATLARLALDALTARFSPFESHPEPKAKRPPESDRFTWLRGWDSNPRPMD